MTKVTYKPTDSADADSVEAFGHKFEEGKAIDITNGAHLAKLRGNAQFVVSGERVSRAAAPETDTDVGEDVSRAGANGAAAKAAGKKRSVPPIYRGKPEEEQWLAGYDGSVSSDADAAARAREQEAALAEARNASEAGE